MGRKQRSLGHFVKTCEPNIWLRHGYPLLIYTAEKLGHFATKVLARWRKGTKFFGLNRESHTVSACRNYIFLLDISSLVWKSTVHHETINPAKIHNEKSFPISTKILCFNHKRAVPKLPSWGDAPPRDQSDGMLLLIGP